MRETKQTRCAILCSGLSVRDHDLSKIDVPIIGVNWSVLGRLPMIHVISNRVLIEKYEHRIEELSPDAAARFSGTTLDGAYTPKWIMKYTNMEHYRQNLQIPPLPASYNIYRDGWVFAGGGPCALQVAISYRFTEIIFVGLDLEHGRDFHFYSHEDGAHRSEYSGYSSVGLDRAWTVQRSYFEKTKDQFISEMGLRIINTGKSDVFNQVAFKEIFP